MSTVRVRVPDGEVEMPLAQAATLARLNVEYPGSTWHFNDCGCCVCLHPGGDNRRGWIIGSDGEADYREVAHR